MRAKARGSAEPRQKVLRKIESERREFYLATGRRVLSPELDSSLYIMYNGGRFEIQQEEDMNVKKINDSKDKSVNCFRNIRRYLLVAVFVSVGLSLFGVASVMFADGADYYFTSDKFCASSCHEMTVVYKEYKESSHYKTTTGVRPQCADCHVSDRLTFAMWDHVIGLSELFK